ncbi:NAD(P)(+)--arginine ADP-ribosyltransferase 2-like [Chrysemys picta bellii]|uniref:NAD(P)(+)--arginine ADP-ribosyltransferase 2-like n=1 Tax=Chrysemys picta bellii TaxID=8478 RepID=UPI0032B2C396
MSPEKIALLLFTAAWLLPAGTAEASPPGTGVGEGNPTLDLAFSSVDDLYEGCTPAMRQQLLSLLKNELTKNKNFHLAWNKAKEEWMRKKNMLIFPNTMRAFCSVAVMAYTLKDPPLYKDFDTATRTGWTGPDAYASYPFKALHFLLTRAPKDIWGITPSCVIVYRGTDVMFSVTYRRLFRFGQFTSTSKSLTVATNFGKKTIFILVSCIGYAVQDLSPFPKEEEVLVLPSEMFLVTEIKRTWTRQAVYAKSVGVCSNHNCAYTGKGDPNLKKCPPHQVLHL